MISEEMYLHAFQIVGCPYNVLHAVLPIHMHVPYDWRNVAAKAIYLTE